MNILHFLFFALNGVENFFVEPCLREYQAGLHEQHFFDFSLRLVCLAVNDAICFVTYCLAELRKLLEKLANHNLHSLLHYGDSVIQKFHSRLTLVLDHAFDNDIEDFGV